jgi:hypothetical protein
MELLIPCNVFLNIANTDISTNFFTKLRRYVNNTVIDNIFPRLHSYGYVAK